MMKLDSNAFLEHKDIRLKIFAYLDGAKLYHKIAVLDKTTRVSLPTAGILD